MKKTCIVTSTRAEYGLLLPLIKELSGSNEIDLQLVVTGTHLIKKYGNTIDEIKESGIAISKTVHINIENDSPMAISKSMGDIQIKFSEVFTELKPDLLILLGDRFEILPIASTAMILNIPIAHLHGGELTEGALDDAIRHCVSKLSYLHFTACEEYRNRVIQLGEEPARVFNVGALCGDNILNTDFMSKQELEKNLSVTLGKKNYLITFHPVTLEGDSGKEEFRNLLESLDELKNSYFIFTFPNADPENQYIIDEINNYVKKNPYSSSAFKSLGMRKYLSLMKLCDGVIGNSSSGIIEAPFFNVPTLNIGDRQKGRVRAKSVFDCATSHNSIKKGIKQLLYYSKEEHTENPFGNGGAAQNISRVLHSLDLTKLKKKQFFNMD
jgi:GDP/UDP-N,N'-diacetylbacillosamine 2-epimerase (hydrolysing)